MLNMKGDAMSNTLFMRLDRDLLKYNAGTFNTYINNKSVLDEQIICKRLI